MTLTPPEADEQAEARARRYVDHVRAALPDVPVDEREALLDGLAEHLLEPGEDRDLLLDEVPSPQAYAAELRASLPPAPPPYPRAPVAGPGPAPARRFPVVAVVLAVVGTLVLLSVLALVAGLVLWTAGPSAEPPAAVTSVPEASVGSGAFALPDVTGLDEAVALARLEQFGVAVTVVEAQGATGTAASGVVLATEPAAPSLVVAGSEVVLLVAP